MRCPSALLSIFLSLGAAAAFPAAAGATAATVVALVTDDPLAHPALLTDASLVNAWGISYAPSGPFWVSNNGTGTSTLYQVDPVTQAPSKVGLTVSIPGAGTVTGQAFNGDAAAFNGDAFLFASEDGTISGWRGVLGTTAEVLQTGIQGNAYKGVALATITGSTYLYATNFATGAIDVLKGSPLAPNLTGNFLDPNLPAGYSPFNVANLGGTLYVSYAVKGTDGDDVPGAGNGIVDAFDLQGILIRRVATSGVLDSPWGLAIAPSTFGELAGSLLVGNFGDGTIHAFDPVTGTPLGALTGGGGTPLVIDGLWGLIPGNGTSAGSSGAIYFSAGPDGESHGLFGVIRPVPEPGTGTLLGAAFAALGVIGRRRTHRGELRARAGLL